MAFLVTNLYLVRHAHSTYTPDEIGRPLSTKGFTDAKRISNILENENIDVLISSPYKRAVQTVARIATVIGKEVIIDGGFIKEDKGAAILILFGIIGVLIVSNFLK